MLKDSGQVHDAVDEDDDHLIKDSNNNRVVVLKSNLKFKLKSILKTKEKKMTASQLDLQNQ